LIDPLTGLPYTSSTTDPIPVTLTEGSVSVTIGEVSQGPAGPLSTAWPIEITDGTNVASVSATGAAASFAGSKAAVVDVRPGGVLPASAAPSDAVANSTTVSLIGSWMGSFNGTTWDRVRSGLTAVTSTLTGFLNHLPFGQYNSPSPTLTPGQAIVIQLDQNGNLQVNLASKIAGELQTYNVMNSHPASVEVALHTATSTGVQDYTGACICAGIEIQTPVASTVIQIYDSVGSAANLKGQVTLPASLLNDGPLPPFCVGMEFVNGIWFVMSTGASVVAVKVAAAS